MSTGRRELDLRSLLGALEDAFPIDVVDVLGRELGESTQARHVALLIANFSGDALVRLSHVSGGGPAQAGLNERVEAVSLPGTIYQEVVFTQTPRVVERGQDWLALVPVTERGDAIGVLEASFADEPGDELLGQLVAAAHALAYVLIASRRHTDLFEWAQRDVPFSVSAEIQRRLLPSAYTAEAGPLTLAGWLEPSHDAGGDTFDYSLDREHLYLSVTDAMGHGTAPPCSPPSPSAPSATVAGPWPPRPSRRTPPASSSASMPTWTSSSRASSCGSAWPTARRRW